jgi:hypothetical protein
MTGKRSKIVFVIWNTCTSILRISAVEYGGDAADVVLGRRRVSRPLSADFEAELALRDPDGAESGRQARGGRHRLMLWHRLFGGICPQV